MIGLPFSEKKEIQSFSAWERAKSNRTPLSFGIELTERCNCDCRHCYVNLPAGDRAARERELSSKEIGRIAEEAVKLGAFWCLVTGGEPLLREDFPDIYLALKRCGLLVSVFTNATLVTDEHVSLFGKYPPRDIEITVYGATAATYEAVTRRPGSFDAFRRGLDRLVAAGIKVRLKAMALRSNLHEMEKINAFCRERTKDFHRFDPQLHLRIDNDPVRNGEIRAERLDPAEVVALERSDPDRRNAMQKGCDKLVMKNTVSIKECAECDKKTGCERFDSFSRLFNCGAGNGTFHVAADGTFRLCQSLVAPGTTAELRKISLREAWEALVPAVRELRTGNMELLARCKSCPHINLCLWCPAHAHLEIGRMDSPVEPFCAVAGARAASLTNGKKG